MAAPVYDVRIDWDNTGAFDAGVPTGAQATAFSAGTVDYLITLDADASDVSIGAKVMLYNPGGATLKQDYVFTVTAKPSGFGFTNITVVPAFAVATATNDVLKVVTVTGDDVTERRLARTPLTMQYGRDTARALAPTSPGQAAFELDNNSRDYSPENASSPLTGKVLPARPVRIEATHAATTYTLFRGHTDDWSIQPGPGQRSANVTCLDGLARLSNVTVSTELYEATRTGDAIGIILDAVGWPALERDLDPGATIIPYYWEENTDAWTAIQQLVTSEGMPAFVAIDSTTGNFMFRDRHHRLVRTASSTSQATFRDAGADPRFSWPLEYDHGWKDVVNTIRIEVNERRIASDRTDVWTSDSTVTIPASTTLDIEVSTGDPFADASTPEIDTDYTVITGSVTVSLSRTSGQSTVISLTAGGSLATVAGLKLRAVSVPVARTRVVTVEDTASQAEYGKRAPESFDAPWLSFNDAGAVAAAMLAHRAQRLPVVTIHLTGGNDTIMTQQLARDLSDRITIVDAETGLNSAFFIERIQHEITGAGSQMHETTFACEKASTGAAPSVFRFDIAGRGFNQGVFGL
jgi:hypothetical protein